MFHKNADFDSLTSEQKLELEDKLLKGFAERSVILFAVFAIGSVFYGFQTFDVLKKFNSNLDLSQNVIPRLLFSTLPCLIIIFLQKKVIKNKNLNVMIWALGFPIVYLITCMINVWPIIFNGQHEVYLYFHAANMFCIMLSFLLVAPNIKYSLIHLLTFCVTFFAPAYSMLRQDNTYTNLLLNDSLSSVAVSLFSAYFLFSLRKKIAIYEMKFKNQITPFLGSNLVQAIYTEKLDRLKNFKAEGLILSIDLRGYTQFLQSHNEHLTSAYMEKYHSIVTRLFCGQGGCLHKSNGDGHIFSFGIMDEIDLSDLATLNKEVENANQRKLKIYSNKIHELFPEFVSEFHMLNQEFNIKSNLRVGAAVACGDVKLKVQGDAGTKMELDIEGEVIVKASRLEAYTKLLGEKTSKTASYLILAEEVAKNVNTQGYTCWDTTVNGFQIRDFPSISKVFFSAWENPQNNSTVHINKKSA